jgi:hypothetical protein
MTKFQLISDIILRVTASKPSDDLELEPAQVALWLDQNLNSIVKTTLDDKLKRGEGIDSTYLYPQYNVDVNTENNNGSTVFYIDLDFEPMNLWRDRGIVRVANSDGLGLVNRVNFSELDTLSNLKLSKPSIKNINYSRIKSRLIMHGLDQDTYAINNFDLVYVPLTKALELLGPNDNIYVAEDLIPIIAEQITEIARKELSGINDIENDSVQIEQKANNDQQ